MFSWSSTSRQRRTTAGSSTTTYPAQRVAQTVQGSIRPPEITRSQHIQSYLNDDTLKRSTRKVSTDDSTYDTVFQTTAGDALILRVHLSASGVPAMTLVGVRATHNWLDSRMKVVGFSPIQNDESWKSSRMLLGTAVHQVVEHFQLQPPQILEITDAGLQRLQTNMSSNRSRNNSATSSSNSQVPAPPPPPDYESLFADNMPSIPTNYDSALSGKSRQDLELLLQDELDFLKFASTLEVYQELQTLGSSILDDNVKLAQDNLKKEQLLMQLHSDVMYLQSQLSNKVQEFETLEQRQSEYCAPPDVKSIKKALQRGKKLAMDESEEFADHWVEDGGFDVKDFCKQFLETRTLHHVRAAKLERLEQTSSSK